jgi:hypothetical protein
MPNPGQSLSPSRLLGSRATPSFASSITDVVNGFFDRRSVDAVGARAASAGPDSGASLAFGGALRSPGGGAAAEGGRSNPTNNPG